MLDENEWYTYDFKGYVANYDGPSLPEGKLYLSTGDYVRVKWNPNLGVFEVFGYASGTTLKDALSYVQDRLDIPSHSYIFVITVVETCTTPRN